MSNQSGMNEDVDRFGATEKPTAETQPKERQQRADAARGKPKLAITPPPELQTDPDHGTGELGAEAIDPSRPLNEQ